MSDQDRADKLSARCGGCPRCGSYAANFAILRDDDSKVLAEWFRCNDCGTRYVPKPKRVTCRNT
jgi:predicted RNA-binding Zn-ribbon protein involved in translation (DUF1610 family)